MAGKKKRRLEAIRWLDHCSYSDSGWKSAEDIANLTPSPMVTVGYVAKETKDHVVMVGTLSGSGHTAAGEICLIKSAIVKRWRISDPTA
jgi:hypothetical protein